MRAVLRGMHSADIETLEQWSPVRQEFGFALDLLIGPSDGPGEEVFQVKVCTPKWFETHEMDDGRARSGIHVIFMREWNYRALHSFVERAITRAEGDTWQEVASKLSWLASWEFADYSPS